MTGSTEHPSDEALEAHLLGRSGWPGAIDAGMHLLAGCPRCCRSARERLVGRARVRRELARSVLARGPGEGGPVEGFAAELAAWGVLAAAADAAAPALEAELLGVAAAERAGEVQTNPRFQSQGLARRLTARAREEGFREPPRAVELGELAVEVAESLERAGYPATLAADARAMAWAALGNARRIATDLFGAERAFRAAREHLAEGSGFARDTIEYWSLLGSLRRSQTQFAESRRVLEKALELARRVGARDLEATIVLKLAKTLGEAGDPQAAVGLLEEAAPLLDRSGPEDLSHYGFQALAAWLAELNRPQEARTALERVRDIWLSRMTGQADRLRLDWLEARVLWAEGDRSTAAEVLHRVQRAFRDLDAWYDVALVDMDLAVLYLEDGRTDEVRRLAREMLPVFTSRALHRRAAAALVLFQRAVEAEEVTTTWVRSLARYLRHARGNPFLTFQPPS
ncbi:MAG TPA: tetratricopeptide repeat protein [Thermoanaerobaculia bacterium]|nr:tetratricopeptide repeat protein [Thermoanaerobaculia bacterium]